MSASYTFLPWVRQGLANRITASDLDPAVKLRADMDVGLTLAIHNVDGTDTSQDLAARKVQLYGPGDVIGLDSRAVVRTDPRNWITTRRTLLDGAAVSLRRLPALRIEREAARLVNARDRLRVLGPGATLERGYAIVQDDAGAVVREAGAVAVGQRVGVRLATGRLGARVEDVQP